MKSSLDYAFYATLFLSTAGVTGRITNPPQNTVAEVEGQAIFNCTSDLAVQSWIFSKTREEVVGSTGQSIVANCAVLAGFATDYDVDRPGGNNNSCNLIINATTMQQAGVYTCSDTQTGPSAILTTTDRDTTITVKKQPETVEGETVTMSYTVRYNTSTASNDTPTIQPVLTWTDFDGNTVTSTPSSTANSVTSSISVTAGRQDIRSYTCHISYTSPSTKPSFASNTPNSVSNPPTTSNINVTSAKCSQDDHKVIIIVCIVSYILGNIIATVFFLVYYNRNIVFKRTLNDRFPCLRKMLPCMNENVACGCGWIFLSVCVFTLVGLVFIILMIIIAKCGCCCSQERGRSEAPVKHFNNPSDYPGPDDDDDPYGKINIGIHSASQDNTRKGKDKKKQQNGKKKRNEKSTDERKNQPPPNVDNRTADPSSSPPIPPSDAPQHQQSTSAQGTVYSELPVTNLNIQPQQYIEGNNDASNYGELKKT